MGGLILTLANRSARGFVWFCLVLSAMLFVGSSALHRYENRAAAAAEVEYRLNLAGRLSEYGFNDEQAAELIAAPIDRQMIDKGEKLLSGFGYSEGSPIGGEYAYFPYLASDILTVAGVILTMAVGMAMLRRVFKEIHALSEQLEQDMDISAPNEHDTAILAEAAAALRAKTRHLLSQLKADKQYLADYLNDFSHQIKTPCTGLILNNDILSSAPMPYEEQLDYFKRDRRCLEKISLLTAASLKLARLDAGAVEYSFEQVDISEPVAEAVTQLSGIAAENGAEIINEVGRGMTLSCDRLWLCEAVTNLMKNAAEHSHGGRVRVYADSDPMTLRLYIEDNGCGISEEELPKVFHRFYSRSRAVSPNSVGIGMSAAKRIIEDMNGRIYIDSEPDVGTKIKIEFLTAVTLL